jgi:hypothetical protein
MFFEQGFEFQSPVSWMSPFVDGLCHLLQVAVRSTNESHIDSQRGFATERSHLFPESTLRTVGRNSPANGAIFKRSSIAGL